MLAVAQYVRGQAVYELERFEFLDDVICNGRGYTRDCLTKLTVDMNVLKSYNREPGRREVQLEAEDFESCDNTSSSGRD
jgi:hypothetical protein